MRRGQSRTASSLGGNDPRARRGTGAAGNTGVQIGAGLDVDREGRVALKKIAAVEDLPSGYTLADVADRMAKLLDALKRGDHMEA